MMRVMWLLRRKPDISFEDFRNHYENSHAVLGERYLGHLLLAYRRTYIVPAPAATAESTLLQRIFASKAWDYDCITEWELKDEAAFEQILAVLANPAIGKLFHDDEDHFLDRSSVRLILGDRHETDTSTSIAPTLSGDLAAGSADNLWNV